MFRCLVSKIHHLIIVMEIVGEGLSSCMPSCTFTACRRPGRIEVQALTEMGGVLQARPEHSMVLRPNSASESCSLTLEYTQPVKRNQPPSLIIEMANPRMLVLFRCVDACMCLAYCSSDIRLKFMG